MPELPDVESFCKYFDSHALNKKIIRVTINNPRVLRGMPENILKTALERKNLVETTRHGKYLFSQISKNGWLLMHFGMTGYLLWFEDPSGDHPHDRVLLSFEKGHMAFVDQRMLGRIGIVTSPERFIEENTLGIDAMQVTEEKFLEIFEAKSGQVKPLLMDQSLMAGVGNEYSDEILFQAGIHPLSKLKRSEDWRKVFVSMRNVFSTAIKKNADTETFPDNFLLKTRRKGEKCPICGGNIDNIKVGGRTGYYCVNHQRKI